MPGKEREEISIQPITSVSRRSIAQGMIEKYDEEMDAMLDPRNNFSLSSIHSTVMTQQVLLSNMHKHVEKVLSNMAEDERKVQISKYLGWINSRSVLVLTGCAIFFLTFSFLCQVFSQFWVKVAETLRLTGRVTPMGSTPTVGLSTTVTPPSPSVTLSPVDGFAAEAAKAAEKAVANWAEGAKKAAEIAQMLLQLAHAREQGFQTIHRSEEEGIKFDRQQNREPAVSRAAQEGQEGIRLISENINQENNAKLAIIRN